MDLDRLPTRWLLAAAAVLVAIGPWLRHSAIGAAAGVAAVAFVGLAVVDRVTENDRLLLAVLVGAFAIRFAVVLADTSFHLFPKADATSYHFRAATLAESWWQGTPWAYFNNPKTTAYEAVVAPFYLWFGPAPLLGRTVNIVFATLATWNVFRIGREVFDRRTGLFAAGIFALFPSIVRIHGEQLREALIILLITQVIYLLVAGRLDEPLGAALFAGSMALMVPLRRQTFAALLVAVVVLAGLSLRDDEPTRSSGRDDYRRLHPAAIAVGVLLAGGGLLLVADQFTGGAVLSDWVTPLELSDTRDYLAQGGARYLPNVTFTTWWDVLLYLPVGAFYFLFTPFPWQIHNLVALVAAVENLLVFYPIALIATVPLISGLGRWRPAGLAAYLVVGVLGYGLVEGNAGTALRHRAQFTWVLFVFAATRLESWWARLRTESRDRTST